MATVERPPAAAPPPHNLEAEQSVLGAILLTGYMGGAIATHVRLEEPFIIQTLLGVVVWLGIFLRDARLRQLIPLRR